MAYAVSQGIPLVLGGVTVTYVTQVTVSENSPNIDTSNLGLASGQDRTFIPGLRDAAEVSMNHIGTAITVGDKVGGLVVGAITFSGATVMSSEVAYRVGEVVAFTSTIRASN
jgi:hypothetical protein